MRASDFTGATFEGCGMRGCAVMGANFNDCRIIVVTCVKANLRAASFDGAFLSNMNSEVVLSMNDARFTQTYLAGATFRTSTSAVPIVGMRQSSKM